MFTKISIVNASYDKNKNISENKNIKTNSTNNEYSKDSKKRRQSMSMLNSEKPEYIEADTVSL